MPHGNFTQGLILLQSFENLGRFFLFFKKIQNLLIIQNICYLLFVYGYLLFVILADR